MANLRVDWEAECEYCGHQLGKEFCDDQCPDRNDFDTEFCGNCNEEVCQNCAGSEKDIHKHCEEEEEEENE